ncbi:hypothetical protein PC9H_005135 [Pleurotus ostreatus]|uniref:ferric-chelate reductase (NADPH) n=1 Tax=Pleurotus ostreatus TaxID=5322 RepID=A0A8H6ZZ09_PLEOS|nr:uncharacterized protein PC9H_005135 [Pleurotus ostreatus]KAF7433186.1 hypothetical protein PC9H_005135 [Pleurotus ostreatus]KAJ8698172.1 ferric-chelate reductase Frp1 [Pleurotus ostreatus]
MLSPKNALATMASSSAADRAVRDALEAKSVQELWYILASVIGLLAFLRVARDLASNAPTVGRAETGELTEKGDAEQQSNSPTGKSSLRRLPNAIVAAFKIVAFRWSIPIGPQATMSVAELTFILGYITVIFVREFVQTRDLSPTFWQDRAAHLASCQVPLIIALAGKNNIISFLTGVSHERLNVLHRAAARTCFVLAWIHVISRTSRGLGARSDFSHNWMIAGAIALVAFTLATFISFRPIRNAAFEFFLISHIILIAIFVICGYFHAREEGFGAYFWSGLVVWAADRVLRFCRILWNNRGGNATKATVELLAEDTTRVTIRRRMNWTPGQHAYLIFPTVSKLPSEAHPFTIASIPTTIEGTNERELVFLIRGQGGFTRRLQQHVTSSSSEPVPVYIDGPYGNPPNLHVFSTCILIAGGSGVSYTLGLFHDLVRNHSGRKSSVRRVVFVWAVRDGAHLTWITEIITKALNVAPPSLSIEPRIYVTGPNYPIPKVPALQSDGSTRSSTSSLPSDLTSQDLPQYSALKLSHGRPSMKKLLQDEINSALGSVSVDVAGPSALSHSVRRVLADVPASPTAALKGTPDVTLHVETFGMVKT